MHAFLLCAMLAFGLPAAAQQNFFNVASSSITPKGSLFFQEQLNVGNGFQQSNTTLDLGLGHNAEIGINLNGFGWDQRPGGGIILNEVDKPYAPFAVLNAQKRFDLGERFAIAFGFQYGLTTTSHVKNGALYYSNLVYDNEALGLKLVAGPYHATTSYFGEGDLLFDRSVGVQAGVEKRLIADRLVMQTDFISGTHSLGELVPGFAYNLSQHWILSMGYQLPTMGSTSVRALVLELTFDPATHEHAAHGHTEG